MADPAGWTPEHFSALAAGLAAVATVAAAVVSGLAFVREQRDREFARERELHRLSVELHESRMALSKAEREMRHLMPAVAAESGWTEGWGAGPHFARQSVTGALDAYNEFFNRMKLDRFGGRRWKRERPALLRAAWDAEWRLAHAHAQLALLTEDDAQRQRNGSPGNR